MVRKPRNAFGFPAAKSSKPADEPAPRNSNYENMICGAIRDRLRISFTYKDEVRLFEPHAVFTTSKGKTCVAGNEVRNLSDPTDQLGPHDFEIGRMSYLSLTDTNFTPDPRFDRTHATYRLGILCSV